MRSFGLLLMVALLATACASSKDDAGQPNLYVYGSGPAEPAPDIDIGTWSGATSDGGQATLVLAEDGSGLLCWTTAEKPDKSVLRRVRYRGGILMTENNLKLAITDAPAGAMKMQTLDATVKYELRSDPDLLLASPACGPVLKKRR
ncbi:hypothetical protein [Hydrocarboniphaga sp.]|uniref:hypothetical protein n=1 Tax=Hydrocarboniphaga sp. TaxID=2033016 RepID=UPI003D0CDDFA